ncbi:Hypothetical protein PHPALM_7442 [Phytophthora palmivora]|uniref:PiggyBac transposable element-derived protein domain-containing protein n=1 Tax=Phytophthora palmivora TaxID=4796 RepID=A0A2P4YCA7_9STRA|nr:Hypothetical protein PHPALM_7442 [Phytophthora palmivora]
MWMDNHPVHMISTGGSRSLGPVYIHDQLRMQRYSIQLAYKPKKYYRSLFFGLVDMAMVNAFIVHRYHMKTTGQKPPAHCKFMETLHEQLLAVDEAKFREIEVSIWCFYLYFSIFSLLHM